MGARGDQVRLSARQNARLRARFTDLRRGQGLSERGLAEQVGLSYGAVRSIGRTVGGPTLGTLLAVARGLNLKSIDELLAPAGLTLLSQHDELEEAIGEPQMTVVMGADLNQGARRTS